MWSKAGQGREWEQTASAKKEASIEQQTNTVDSYKQSIFYLVHNKQIKII